MSHARGTVLVDAEIVGHFEYEATCGVALRAVQRTREELERKWRTSENDRECLCGDAADARPVVLEVDYGNGFEWESTVCFRCMTITGHRDQYAHIPDDHGSFGFG